MKRAIVLLLDSFGIGASHDADKYGDVGANTFGHIANDCTTGNADKAGLRQGPLLIPNLTKLGLVNAAEVSCGEIPNGLAPIKNPSALYGAAIEQSFGKDTPSGHWEIAGVPVLFEWGYFTDGENGFPQALIDEFIEAANLPGVLGVKHASGTEIINELGDEHVRTGKPIVYTSADSVFQVAAHEKHFGLDRLYAICDIARTLVDKYNIGRVIARPFIGKNGDYTRTGNRRDIATPPPAPTLFDDLLEQGGTTIAIGKTADIFAHQGISQEIKADGNDALFTATLEAMDVADDKTLIFSNFVDFDSKYGHRRDVAGYAAALEHFDRRLPELIAKLQDGDVVIITADHGCDPTLPGSDHSREHIPVLAFGPKIPHGNIGLRKTFADIGQSIATHLTLRPLANGVSFL
jgi:phosphopentomutase